MGMSNLITYLDDARISRAELARRLNTSRGYVTDIVTGRRKPGRDMAIAIERETGGAVPVTAWARPVSGVAQ